MPFTINEIRIQQNDQEFKHGSGISFLSPGQDMSDEEYMATMVLEMESDREYRVYALVRTPGPSELSGGQPIFCRVTRGTTRGVYPRPDAPQTLDQFNFVDHWMLGKITPQRNGTWQFKSTHDFQNLNLCSDWDACIVGTADKYTTNKEIKMLGRKGIMIDIIPN